VSRPAQDSTVRVHRMSQPNRRPLLISAILVALTSIPTLVAVAAGTVSLRGDGTARPPAIAGQPSGPIIVEPGASTRPREQPPAARQSTSVPPPGPEPTPMVGSGGRSGYSSGTGVSPERGVGSSPSPSPSAVQPTPSGSTGGSSPESACPSPAPSTAAPTPSWTQ
jgi:hypothetical protein